MYAEQCLELYSRWQTQHVCASNLACETGPFVCIWQVCLSRIDQLAAHGLARVVETRACNQLLCK